MARQRDMLSEAERDLYLAKRTRGDVRAYRRGGFLALALRVAKRRTRRTAARKTGGWL